MRSVFSRQSALRVNAWGLLLVLLLLVATPVRSTGVIALLMLYGIGYLIAHRESLRLARLDWWVVLLLSALLIGRIGPFMVGGYSARYLSDGLHMVASIPIYLMLRHAISVADLGQLRRWLEWGVSGGAIGGMLLALYQTQWLNMGRADGFLYSINFGYLNAMLMALALGLLPGSTRRWGLLLAAVAVAAVVAVTLSGTRGAMLAILGVVVLLLLLNLRRVGVVRSLGILLLGIIGLVGAYQGLPVVEQRVDKGVAEVQAILDGNLQERGSSTGHRIQLWVAAWEAFKQRPSIGLSYPEREALNDELVEAGAVIPWVDGVSRGHAHSQYFEMLATGGVVGIIALLGYLLMPALYHGWRWRRQPDNAFALAGLGFTVAVAICGLTEVLLQQEMIAAFYAYMQAVLVALGISHARGKEEEIRVPTP
ncbi:O-antigen ligase family protein [Halomonas salifodinae]|uniref:O-antigen ligase family protein n=1 Tax=Halomonas salifodinae TaxID=438745 RepID=A0ABW2EWW5_9GAMM